jgi:hypothetical protein
MASEQKSVLTKLVAARDVTRLTGTVDELQSHNLQMWGVIAFSPAKFALNWNGTERVVEYDVMPGPPDPPEFPDDITLLAYLKGIDTSVKDLLGQEWLLVIKEGGKTVFTGERKDIIRPDPEAADKLLKQPFKPQEAVQVPARGEMEFDVKRDKT